MNRLNSSENLNRFSSKRLSCRIPSRGVPRGNQVGTIDAISSGSAEALARALKSGADPNETDKDGIPAIFLTLEKSGRPDMLRLLLEYRAEPDARQPIVNRTCLHAAAKLGYQLCVASLLSYGADASLVDFKGNTALMHAARNGHSPIVRLLARHEADYGQGKNSIADISNLRGETVLHAAVESGDSETVRLLSRGAVDPNRPDHTGKTAFLLACRLNNLPLAEILLQESYKEIAINVREPDTGRTSLFWAVLHANVKLVQLLINRGAEVDVADKDWQTPFLLAVKRGGDELIMKLLIDAGCNAAVTDRSFNTALHYAASEGIAESIPLLVKAGLDPNIKGACGLTALMLASYRGHVDVVKLLLAFGSNADLQDRLHCSAIAYALVGETKKLPSYVSPKLSSTNDPVLQCLKALIKSNCNLDNGNGFKRLCTCYSIDVANRNVEDLEDEKMYTPLEIAFLKNNVNAFRILLQAGCDLKGFTLGSKDVSLCKDKSFSHTMISMFLAKKKIIPSLKLLCRKPALKNLQLHGVPMSEIGDLDFPEEILNLLNFSDLDLKSEDEAASSYMDKINHFNSIISLKNKPNVLPINQQNSSKSMRSPQVQLRSFLAPPSPIPSSSYVQKTDKTRSSQSFEDENNSNNSSSFKRSFSTRPTKLPVGKNISNPSHLQPFNRDHEALSRSNSVRSLKNTPSQSATPQTPVWGYNNQKSTRARTSSSSEDNCGLPTTSMPTKPQSVVNINECSPNTTVHLRTSGSKIGVKQQRHSMLLENDYRQNSSAFVTNTGQSTNKKINFIRSETQNDVAKTKPNSTFLNNEKYKIESHKQEDKNDIDELIARYKNRYKSDDTSSIYEKNLDSKFNQTNSNIQTSNSNSDKTDLDNFNLNVDKNCSYSLTDDVFGELEKRGSQTIRTKYFKSNQNDGPIKNKSHHNDDPIRNKLNHNDDPIRNKYNQTYDVSRNIYNQNDDASRNKSNHNDDAIRNKSNHTEDASRNKYNQNDDPIRNKSIYNDDPIRNKYEMSGLVKPNQNLKISPQILNNINIIDDRESDASRSKFEKDGKETNEQLDDYISELYDRYQMIKKSSLRVDDDRNNSNNNNNDNRNNNNNNNRNNNYRDNNSTSGIKAGDYRCLASIDCYGDSTSSTRDKFASDSSSFADRGGTDVVRNQRQNSSASRGLKKSTVVISSVVPPTSNDEIGGTTITNTNDNISIKNKPTELPTSPAPYSKQVDERTNLKAQNITAGNSVKKSTGSNFVRSVSTPENRRYSSVRLTKTKSDYSGADSVEDLSFRSEKKSGFKARLRSIKESVQSSTPKIKQPVMQNFLLR